jgi:hypothetical protein
VKIPLPIAQDFARVFQNACEANIIYPGAVIKKLRELAENRLPKTTK